MISIRDLFGGKKVRSIYLAGPMTGYPKFNSEQFDAVAKVLRYYGHTVFNPCEWDREKYGAGVLDSLAGNPADCVFYGFSLRESLAADLEFICLSADTMVLLPLWENSKGAQAEHRVAVVLGHGLVYTSEADCALMNFMAKQIIEEEAA